MFIQIGFRAKYCLETIGVPISITIGFRVKYCFKNICVLIPNKAEKSEAILLKSGEIVWRLFWAVFASMLPADLVWAFVHSDQSMLCLPLPALLTVLIQAIVAITGFTCFGKYPWIWNFSCDTPYHSNNTHFWWVTLGHPWVTDKHIDVPDHVILYWLFHLKLYLSSCMHAWSLCQLTLQHTMMTQNKLQDAPHPPFVHLLAKTARQSTKLTDEFPTGILLAERKEICIYITWSVWTMEHKLHFLKPCRYCTNSWQ